MPVSVTSGFTNGFDGGYEIGSGSPGGAGGAFSSGFSSGFEQALNDQAVPGVASLVMTLYAPVITVLRINVQLSVSLKSNSAQTALVDAHV